MMPYLKEEYGNPGTLYGLGRRAAQAIDESRQHVARLIGCDAKQIIFTSSGSEANNLVFSGTKRYLQAINKTHIITSEIEHDSVIKAVNDVCKPLCHNDKKCMKSGFHATFLSPNTKGEISVEDLKTSITDKTGLVSLMYVNNEVGSINPVQEIGDLCKGRVLFHTDCVQALGYKNIDVSKFNCDFLSISAHKINAPKGVGALYVKDLKKLSPIILGGTEQEAGYRGGTENVAGIVGFGKACEIMLNNMDFISRRAVQLKLLFQRTLMKYLEEYKIETNVYINSPYEESKILNMRFEGIDGQTLVLMLDGLGVCISSGSACRSMELEPSRVLKGIGISDEKARQSVRFSFSHMETEENIIRAAIATATSIKVLSEIST